MNKPTYRQQVLRRLDQPLTLIEGASPPNTPEECSEERGRRTTAYRIMFSADYPYGSMAKARAFLNRFRFPAPTAHGNAESSFRL